MSYEQLTRIMTIFERFFPARNQIQDDIANLKLIVQQNKSSIQLYMQLKVLNVSAFYI